MALAGGSGCWFEGQVAAEGFELVDEPHSALALADALFTVILGLAAFRLSRSGTRPLI